jgi:hypothetical protein
MFYERHEGSRNFQMASRSLQPWWRIAHMFGTKNEAVAEHHLSAYDDDIPVQKAK